ncbi:MAG TPA: TIGR03668 family PPOX class F420-dependent oxidoreductase [Actinomycetota bacterium]|nr:TIGR03668 family PPOX class F420-dependent oxidoreductase [Actinomycetota bacterium]
MSGPPENFAWLLRTRVGYLATIGADESPHIIPVCFTWAGDVVWTAVDGKTKSSNDLQRLRDIEATRSVAFLVDRWDEDWSRLAWLQARGNATIIPDGKEWDKAVAALKSKYAQYSDTPIDGPVIRINVSRWVGWAADATEA